MAGHKASVARKITGGRHWARDPAATRSCRDPIPLPGYRSLTEQSEVGCGARSQMSAGLPGSHPLPTHSRTQIEPAEPQGSWRAPANFLTGATVS